MNDERSQHRNIHTDAPGPGDESFVRWCEGRRPEEIAKRHDVSYEARRRFLQRMRTEASAGEVGKNVVRREEIEQALDILEAEAVTDADEPTRAPQKSGYRPQK